MGILLKKKISYPSRAPGFILFVVGSLFVVLNLHVLWFLFYLSSFYVMCPMMHVSLNWRYGLSFKFSIRRVWRYQRGNQKSYIEEEQTTQWPREKVQKDKQRSTIHTYKTKDRVRRTPLRTESEFRCSGRVSSSRSTSGIRRVNLVTNPVISNEWRKDWKVLTTSVTYPKSFVTQDIP